MERGPIADAEGLRKILESLPDFVLMVDREGRIQYVNRLDLGFSRDGVIGIHVEDTMLPVSRRAFREAFHSVLSGGATAEYEAEVTLPDGTGAWFRSQVSSYRDGGEIVGVVLVAENITELRLAQESAAALRKLLPICSWCDRIRDDAGAWESIEAYVARMEDAKVTHGLCEDCFERQMKGLADPGESDDYSA
jgi:PAS domain S-box-containing protein